MIALTFDCSRRSTVCVAVSVEASPESPSTSWTGGTERRHRPR